MSWHAVGFGKGEEAVTRVKAELEQSKRFGNRYPEVLDAIARVADAVREHYPERDVLVETTGHLDGYAGNFTVTVRVFPLAVERERQALMADVDLAPHGLPLRLTEQEVG